MLHKGRLFVNVTFLIGNGFDIGLGLKSRFSDYFPVYLKQSLEKDVSLQQFAKKVDKNRDEWSYFERQLGIYTQEFTADTKQLFYDQVKDFQLGFIQYLESQESNLDFSNQNRISTMMKKALIEYRMSSNLSNSSSLTLNEIYKKHIDSPCFFNFINYNYTSLLDRCVETIDKRTVATREVAGIYKIDQIGKCIHVHGKKDSHPIMGVNDISQIKNESLAQDKNFARRIVKPLVNAAHRTLHEKECSDLITASHIIVVYGMSLGETDKLWWNKIIKWLHDEEDRQLVIFVYDKEYNASCQFDFLNKEDTIIDTLAEYNENAEIQVEEMRERIHIAVQKNIFELNLAIEHEKTMEKATDIVWSATATV